MDPMPLSLPFAWRNPDAELHRTKQLVDYEDVVEVGSCVFDRKACGAAW
jgi:hypothetical protein